MGCAVLLRVMGYHSYEDWGGHWVLGGYGGGRTTVNEDKQKKIWRCGVGG